MERDDAAGKKKDHGAGAGLRVGVDKAQQEELNNKIARWIAKLAIDSLHPTAQRLLLSFTTQLRTALRAIEPALNAISEGAEAISEDDIESLRSGINDLGYLVDRVREYSQYLDLSEENRVKLNTSLGTVCQALSVAHRVVMPATMELKKAVAATWDAFKRLQSVVSMLVEITQEVINKRKDKQSNSSSSSSGTTTVDQQDKEGEQDHRKHQQ